MEDRMVFKNKGYRRLCVTAIVISAVFAAFYIALEIINLKYCGNYPRLICRAGLLVLYTVEMCLFAHRNSIYMEIGGDFALARRSGTFMIILLIISAIVEAYYVSATSQSILGLLGVGRYKMIYMCVIIAIGALSTLPLIQFEYFNIDIVTMRISAIIGIFAALVSFSLGACATFLSYLRFVNDMGAYASFAVLFDNIAPVFLVHILPCIILMRMSYIIMMKEIKLNARLTGVDNSGEKDDNVENY